MFTCNNTVFIIDLCVIPYFLFGFLHNTSASRSISILKWISVKSLWGSVNCILERCWLLVTYNILNSKCWHTLLVVSQVIDLEITPDSVSRLVSNKSRSHCHLVWHLVDYRMDWIDGQIDGGFGIRLMLFCDCTFYTVFRKK